MQDELLLELLHDTATAVRVALDAVGDWGEAGTMPGQHHSDLAADAAALAVLARANVGVLSEESGLRDADRPVIVVLDPLDGSTNASRRLPWFATSLCAVDGDGPRAALVVDQSSGARYSAVRGGGASVDGRSMKPTSCERLREAIVGLSGSPPGWLGWKQYRALGAVALDLCAVADGRLDAYLDCSYGAHGPWDYLGGLLVCQEAGVGVVDAFDRELVEVDHLTRRTPLAAATPALLEEVVAARRTFVEHAPWASESDLLP